MPEIPVEKIESWLRALAEIGDQTPPKNGTDAGFKLARKAMLGLQVLHEMKEVTDGQDPAT